MSWTDDRVSMLREFWGQGLSANQIAQRIGGVTRNAVIGKAHRLGLDGRPSPIKAGTPGSAARVRPAPAAKRVPVPRIKFKVALRRSPTPAQGGAPVAGQPPVAGRAPVAGRFVAATRGAVSAAQFGPSSALRYVVRAGGQACKWPHGDPGDADFHFCGAPAADGRPYCPEHCAIAYVRRDSRSAA